MEEDWNGQMGFQHRSSGLNSTEAVAVNVVPELDVKSGSALNSSHEGRLGSCYGSGWDPIGSLGQSDNFGASLMVSHGNFPLYPVGSENTGLRAASQFIHHISSDAPNSVEMMLPKQSVFGGVGGSLSAMVNSYGLRGFAQNSGAFNKSIMIEKASMDPMQSEEDCQKPKETSLGTSSTSKRKRNAEGNVQKDASDDISDEKEFDEKKQKYEEKGCLDQRNKQMGGQTKDNSPGGEASNGNYVHVRARKGQATNSHSLAERVRREKINDRMKLLQELVPGCNKITGKAVMLDEIINYVQSLQQQVEFLSMKLAAVNPELNFNIEQILSKDILHSRGTSARILGLSPGMSSSNPCTTEILQGAFSGISSIASPYQSASQVIKGVWDGDLQNLLHMGFELNPPITDLGPNGNSKR